MFIRNKKFLVRVYPPRKSSLIIQSVEDTLYTYSPLKVRRPGFNLYQQGYFWRIEIKGKDIFLQEKNLRRALEFILHRFSGEESLSLAVSDLGCLHLKLGCKNVAKIVAQQIYKQMLKGKFYFGRVVFFSQQEKIRRQFEKYIISYLEFMEHKMSQGPFLTTDAIIEYKGGIVLVRRRNPPLGWALPGGFVDYGEKAEEAVKREAKEETGLNIKRIRQFGFYSAPQRDSRFHTASIVFTAQAAGKLKSGSDAAAARVFGGRNLPEHIAFDHRKIIKDYLRRKAKLKR